MTRFALPIPGLEAERCAGCGMWTIVDRPCAVCDPAARQAYYSHEWTRDLDPDCPTCARCDAKVWHAAAVLPCEEVDL